LFLKIWYKTAAHFGILEEIIKNSILKLFFVRNILTFLKYKDYENN